MAGEWLIKVESVDIEGSYSVKFRVILIAAVLSLAAGGYAAKRHDDGLWRDYKRVRAGMSESQAKAILGRPSWQEACGATFGVHSDDCASELVYRAAFAPLNPTYWVVEIDSRGRVISSDWIVSP
jgi:hypothetical protein